MKKSLIAAFMLVIVGKTFAATADTLTVTTQPQMHCANCEKKIKILMTRLSQIQFSLFFIHSSFTRYR